MSISLAKGGNISLTKDNPTLSILQVGLGWDVRATDGAAYDLDASAFLLTPADKVRSDADFIFYNQPKSVDGAIEHKGDNRTGQGDGDDESVELVLAKISPDVTKIAFAVTIHDAEARKQSFGQVSKAYMRCVDKVTGKEMARFDLSEDASVETAMIFGEVYRDNSGGWKFRAVGQGFKGGLGPLAKNYGVNV